MFPSSRRNSHLAVYRLPSLIRIQAGKFGFKLITIGTTTNIAEIRKYTEQTLVELPFEVATEKIGIGLQKAWEEAFYWDIIQIFASTLDPMPTVRGPHDGFTPQERVATAKFIEMVGVGTSDENQRKCRLWWKDLSDLQNVTYEWRFWNPHQNWTAQSVRSALVLSKWVMHQVQRGRPRWSRLSQPVPLLVPWDAIYFHVFFMLLLAVF